MQNNQINRIFLLLFMLQNKQHSLSELVLEFKKENIEISKTSLKKYIKILKDNNIKITEALAKNKLIYFIEDSNSQFFLSKEDIKLLCEIKKLILLKKDFKLIRQLMEFYLKLQNLVKDEDLKYELIDFGYYSSINWYILEQLENHCKNKNIIEFQYVLTSGKIKKFTFHADIIKTDNDRLYLYGISKEHERFSQIPIERILYINKIIRKKCKIDFKCEILTAKVKKTNQQLPQSDFIELIDTNEDYYILKYPLIDEFDIVQKLLQFCPNLYEISNEKIKNKLIEKLEKMESFYE